MSTTNSVLILNALLKLGFTQGLAHDYLKDQEVRDSVLADLGREPEVPAGA